MSRTIKKKIRADYFEVVASGQKTFEVRVADWDCRQGDTLELIETDSKANQPTGRSLRRKVGYVAKTKDFSFFSDQEVAKHGYQVISLHRELPEIRIKNAWLLRDQVSKPLYKLYKPPKKFPTDKQVEQKVEDYHRAWQPFEQKILTGMSELLGVSFRQNIIDVYIAPYFKRAFSDPMVIGMRCLADVFVDILTHELLHRLLSDNTTISNNNDDLLKEWRRLFGDKYSFSMTVHIPVHAAHKAIYLDVLKAPERLERDIAKAQRLNATDYLKAWDYVEHHGYQQIIDKLKQSYQKLAKVSS